MSKGTALAPALVFAMLLNAFGQQAPPAPSPQPAPQARDARDKQPEDDEVVRITTKLVQVDVTVTDKNGRQVTDLKPEDFEVFENDRPQTITNFSFVSVAAPPTPAGGEERAEKKEKDKSLPPVPVPAGRLRPGQVQRSIALVVDDLRMSAESMNLARNSLRKYVDEQLQPGDLVAIIRTSAGIGALQQFTHDRQQLHAAIDRVRPVMRAGLRLGAFTDVNTLSSLETAAGGAVLSNNELTDPVSDRTRTGNLSEFRDSLLTVGTVGALNFVVRGLRELPGRKAVVLFSDGIFIFPSAADNSQMRDERVFDALRKLVDNANRASVVFYAIDTRGLQPSGLTAADDTSGTPMAPSNSGPDGALTGVGGLRPDQLGSQVLGARAAEMFEGQNGLRYLAHETGGQTLFNQNDFNKGVRRALEDMRAYYLIGYRPDDSTFDANTGNRRFVKLTVKVKGRSDLRVRTRTGFLNFAEEQARERKRSRAEQMMAALLSPFASGDVKLQLTSFFLNQADTGSTMRSVVLMDARDLTFTEEADGKYKTVLDFIAVTLGESGEVVDQVNVVETIRAKPAAMQRFLREGMVYGLNVPVSRPGAYQVRVAVRDSATGRVGSASQYVEVPKLSRDRLALSSLVISGNNPEAVARAEKAAQKELVRAALDNVLGDSGPTDTRVVAAGKGMVGSEEPLSGPGSRRFRVGMYLDYACVIYNAKGADKKKPPQLTSQARLFHDGKEIFTGQPQPVDLAGQPDLARVTVARRLHLGSVLTPGDYVLLLTVTDELASGNKRTSSRWIDFEVIN